MCRLLGNWTLVKIMETAEERNARVSLRLAEFLESAQREAEDASDDEEREYWTNKIAKYHKIQEGLELSMELAEVTRDAPLQLKDHRDLVQRIDGKNHLLYCIETLNGNARQCRGGHPQHALYNIIKVKSRLYTLCECQHCCHAYGYVQNRSAAHF